MIFIGDIHAYNLKADKYNAIISKYERTIQVGDLGIGFPKTEAYMGFPIGHTFIRGNHDNPLVCDNHPNYMGDYGYKNKIFFLSGAYTPPHLYQMVPGYNWWVDEELDERSLLKALDLYMEVRPKFVVTHMLPYTIQQKIFHFEPGLKCRTSIVLDKMFKFHQPSIWVFGHYHQSKRKRIGKTTFHGLNELEVRDIKLE